MYKKALIKSIHASRIAKQAENRDTLTTLHDNYTDKKEHKIFLIYKKIQKGTVAKSYMTNGLLIYD
jgi:hypothetical protein